jgi:hypothetical protein
MQPYHIVASPDLLENVNGLPRLKPEVLNALESTNPELAKQLVHTQKKFEDRMNLPERIDAKQKEFAEKYPELWQRWVSASRPCTETWWFPLGSTYGLLALKMTRVNTSTNDLW